MWVSLVNTIFSDNPVSFSHSRWFLQTTRMLYLSFPLLCRGDWMKKLGEAEVYETDLHHLILNYLTINGLAGPAGEFTREAQLEREFSIYPSLRLVL